MLLTENCKTIVDCLEYWALHREHQSAFIFLDPNGFPQAEATYRQLRERSLAVAWKLRNTVAKGGHAVLFFQPGLEFIYAFLGCLYAGVTAVPIPPPQGKRQVARVTSIVSDADAEAVISTKAIRLQVDKLDRQSGLLSNRNWVDVDECLSGPHEFDHMDSLDATAIAFLQYTSGSTSIPKGVMVTHRNLISNEKAIYDAFEHSNETKVVGWLPFYHDMGLIGNILHPIFIGCSSVLMAPTTFLRNPLLWLQAISRYRGTTSGGPNFAYELCTQRIPEEALAGLDLSSWKIAFNGSEMVHADTLESFVGRFSKCGFNRNAVYPCYGMAESTLFSTGVKAGSYPRIIMSESSGKRLPLISCGYCREGHQMLIVDPSTKAEAVTGEVWLQGPSIAAGYWNRPEATEQDFRAYTNTGKGPFLRTGDIGIINDKELFIAGRLKNLIIIRGKNYYPDDIEIALRQSHPSLQGQLGAAFSITQGNEEKLVVIFELDRAKCKSIDANGVIAQIRRTLAEEFFLEAVAILLVRAGSIPRTTSGKVQYYQCRERFVDNILSVEVEWRGQSQGAPLPLEGDIANRLKGYCCSLLKIDKQEIECDEPLFSYGFDSLKAIQLLAWLKDQYNLHVGFEDFFNDLTIHDIASLVQQDHPIEKTAIANEYDVHKPFALAPNQGNLLAAYRLDPSDVSYNIPVVLKFTGHFDQQRFEEALHRTIDKHPLLKTVFEESSTGPSQRVLENYQIACLVYTLDALSKPLDEVIREESYRPFDIFKGPVFRVTVIYKGTEETIVLMTFHHLICDGWSMNLFVEDFRNSYNNERLCNECPPYQQFVERQKKYIEGAELAVDGAYWQRLLGDEFPILSLGPYHRHPKKASHQGSSEKVLVEGLLLKKLKDFNQNYRSTVAMTLKAVFHSLLHLYSHQKTILVGYPSANRHSSGLHTTFGYFVNTLVSKSSYEATTSFSEVLRQIRKMVIEGVKHEAFPFQDLLALLNPPRIEGVSPLFQAMFVMQNAPATLSGFSNLDVEILPLDEFPVIYDIVLEAAEADAHISLSFEYRKDVLCPFLVKQFSRHFTWLLERSLELPDEPLGKVSLEVASSEEACRLPYPTSVFELIEDQALQNPGKVAVESNMGAFTYRQLIMKANGIAQSLIDAGLKPHEPVGFCLERSPELIAALIGIAKAGGVYVPIDSNYPTDRINHILSDAGIRFLLVHSATGHKLTQLGAHPFDVSAMAEREFFRSRIKSKDDLAYILYTSGSTGKPKGVMIEHGALANFTTQAVQLFDIKGDDRVLQFSSISWDTSSEEIYPCLISGGTLVLRDNEPLETFDGLLQRTIRCAITVWDLPTSYWQELCDQLVRESRELPPTLRLIIVGGEKISRPIVSKWIGTFGSKVKLLNTYGATEAASISLAFDFAGWSDEFPDPPIGLPLGNVGFLILNDCYTKVPKGVSGHLFLTGAGLARGYLNLPELTEQKFITHPETGERLYHTGDMAYESPEGVVLLQGRSDGMIKRRGFRIEIGEIETALNGMDRVSKCLVLEKKGELKSSSLIAYVSVDDPDFLKTIKDKLLQILPEYMIPDRFICVKDFPRLPNGKIDLKSLVDAVDEVRQEDESLNDLEAAIREIWLELLQATYVSKQTHFFDAGGNSLLIIQLHKRLSDTFSIKFSVSELFKYSTCASQAKLVEELSGSKNAVAMSPLDLLKQLEEGTIDLASAKNYLTLIQK